MRPFRLLANRGLAAGLIAVSCCAAPALAGWGVDPVTVTPTTAAIPLVEGCSDGAYGAFAAWQEEGTPGSGVLRVQHLLGSGDLDPAWPAAGAVACAIVAARSELVALPDRSGGLYLLWKEGVTLYATRLDASGAVAAGWPARGRSLGDVHATSPRPDAIEDGSHGFYAVWVAPSREAVGIHLGPANTGAGGWPNDVLTISYLDQYAVWPQLAPAPGGGIFVAWGGYGDDNYGWTPGVWRLQRLTSAGGQPAGWPYAGIEFGTFHFEYIADFQSASSMLALEGDGRGGVFLMIGNPTDPGSYHELPTLETRLYRLQAGGQSALDWPGAGRIVPHASVEYTGAGSPDGSYRLLSDRKDGVFVGVMQYGTDNASRENFKRCSPDGQFADALVAWGPAGYEVAARGDGGLYTAFFGCCYWVYQFAYIAAAQFPYAPGYYEDHTEEFGTWYTDIGLARTDDGGAVLLWSQVQGRIGLFARRINSAGEVTAVGPAENITPAFMRLLFVPGVGVRATVGAVSDHARIELFDLAGRRLASQAVEPEAAAARGPAMQEVTVAGTKGLPSGLYFGRLTGGANAIAAKVIVAR
jgi:hypothetical protein